MDNDEQPLSDDQREKFESLTRDIQRNLSAIDAQKSAWLEHVAKGGEVTCVECEKPLNPFRHGAIIDLGGDFGVYHAVCHEGALGYGWTDHINFFGTNDQLII